MEQESYQELEFQFVPGYFSSSVAGTETGSTPCPTKVHGEVHLKVTSALPGQDGPIGCRGIGATGVHLLLLMYLLCPSFKVHCDAILEGLDRHGGGPYAPSAYQYACDRGMASHVAYDTQHEGRPARCEEYRFRI